MTRPFISWTSPPFCIIMNPWNHLLLISPMVSPPVSSRYLSSPACALAQLLATLDPLSPLYSVSLTLFLPFPYPLVPCLHIFLPLLLPWGHHRGSHLHTLPWPNTLQLVGQAWKWGGSTPPRWPMLLHQGICQGRPSALPWLLGRPPRVGTHWKDSLPTSKYPPLDSPRKCWIGADRSGRLAHQFNLVRQPLSAE